MEEHRYKYIVIRKEDLLEFLSDQGVVHTSTKYELGPDVEIREVDYDMRARGWCVTLYSPHFDIVEPGIMVPYYLGMMIRDRQYVDIEKLEECGVKLEELPGFYKIPE